MPLRIGLCLLVTCLALPAATIHLWDGSSLDGQVAYGRNTWQYSDGQQRKSLSAHQVYSVRFEARHATPGELARVTLVDGSRLSGTVLPSSRLEHVPLKRSEGSIELPKDEVAAIEFGPLDPGASPEQLPETPYVIMRNGKTIRAELTWMTWLQIGIAVGSSPLRLDREAIHRCQLRPVQGTDYKPGSVQLFTVMGDAVNGQLISLDEKHATLRVGGQNMPFLRKNLLRIDRHDERAVSLLALGEPRVTTTAYLNLIREPRFNRSLFDGALLAHGIRYQQGIAMHSRSRLVYDLDGGYRRFLVDVGLDPTISGHGHAICVVSGDGQELARQVITADGAVKSLSCPVTGVQQLELLVDFGEGGSSGDYVTWGDPRLISP